MTDDDHLPPPMRAALDLARQGLWLTNPNPRVGCVLTAADGAVIGQGHTQQAGGAHAEIMAMRDARARGHDVRGATAWVTLEPCAHQGRTGPCCDALIRAGIARVVASLEDPNPRVAGQGFARLRAAGVQVDIGPGAHASRTLNPGFFSRMVRGTPWVRLKVAASLDGRTALPSGISQWITSAQARADGHAWRARACAVLTGIGTVLADNPRLDVREVATPRQPHLVVLDSQLRLPPNARLFDTPRQLIVYTADSDPGRRRELEQRGAHVVPMPGPTGRVDLAGVLHDLARREVNELHVEAGPAVNGALLAAGLVDESLVYLAPRLLGFGRNMADLGPLGALEDAPAFEFHSVEPVGPDLRILARRIGADPSRRS